MERKALVWALLGLTTVVLSACETYITDANGTGALVDVPEGVVALAAPYQDLSSVRVLEEDGCYWYQHTGPVETTWLPLRTTEGRPICARVQE